MLEWIAERLREGYSPEQISGVMGTRIGVRVSHGRIYQYIWRDKGRGGALYRNLRIAGGARRRKRYGKKDWRGKIPNRVDIDQRPAIVNERRRIGDWEADLVSGVSHQGYLVTLVERRTKYTLIGQVNHKRVDAVSTEIVRLLSPYAAWVRTITYDNGREFSAHELINERLGCQRYFAKPYHA